MADNFYVNFESDFTKEVLTRLRALSKNEDKNDKSYPHARDMFLAYSFATKYAHQYGEDIIPIDLYQRYLTSEEPEFKEALRNAIMLHKALLRKLSELPPGIDDDALHSFAKLACSTACQDPDFALPKLKTMANKVIELSHSFRKGKTISEVSDELQLYRHE